MPPGNMVFIRCDIDRIASELTADDMRKKLCHPVRNRARLVLKQVLEGPPSLLAESKYFECLKALGSLRYTLATGDMNPLILIEMPATKRELHTLEPHTWSDLRPGYACFLPEFASSSIFGAFAVVDTTTWDLPPAGAIAMKRVARIDKKDSVKGVKDNNSRCAPPRPRCSTKPMWQLAVLHPEQVTPEQDLVFWQDCVRGALR